MNALVNEAKFLIYRITQVNKIIFQNKFHLEIELTNTLLSKEKENIKDHT